MSRWLNSVNNLLEKLDDQAENVADETQEHAQTASAALGHSVKLAGRMTGRLLGNRDRSSDDEDDYYDDEEYYDEEEEYYDDEEEEVFIEEAVINLEAEPEESRDSKPLFPNDRVPSQEELVVNNDRNKEEESPVPSNLEDKQAATSEPVAEAKPEEAPGMEADADKEDTPSKANPVPEAKQPSVVVSEPKPESKVSLSPSLPSPVPSPTEAASAKVSAVPKPPPPTPPPLSGTSSSSQQQQQLLKRSQRDFKKATQEVQRLQKLNTNLEAQLEAAQAELQAQQAELQKAGETMQQERLRAEEEREDLLDEHDEAMETLEQDLKNQLAEQKESYEGQLRELHERLDQVEHQRVQEGGDYTQDLEDALERERDALRRLDEVHTEKASLESQVTTLEQERDELESKLESVTASAKEAAERERLAEDKLEEALSAHKHQLTQRQGREAELEQTVAELGAALSAQQQQRQQVQQTTTTSVGQETAQVSYKDQYQVAMEELETVRTQLHLATQQSEALQKELVDINHERLSETATAQERQREYDAKIAELTAQVSRLEGSVRERKQQASNDDVDMSADASSDRVRQLSLELDRAKKQVASLSDQLIRQQDMTESSKSEVLALKGRLQAATSRAEAAEQSLQASEASSSDAQMYELEGGGGVGFGGSRLRRRVKGGRRGRSSAHMPSRSMRSALGIRATSGSAMEQVALTVDAIDSWMLDTFSIMKSEPLARVGFALYLAVLHLWCFALVFFHTVQSERADLGTLRRGADPIMQTTDLGSNK